MRRHIFLCLSTMTLSILAACGSENATDDASAITADAGSDSKDDGSSSGDGGSDSDDGGSDAEDSGSKPIEEASYTAAIGELGGTTYDDTCPSGQVVIGFEGGAVESAFYKGVLSKFRVLCGTPKLPDDGSTKVTIGAGDTVPDWADARGASDVTVAQVTCPADAVVVAIDGDTIAKDFPPERKLLAYLQIYCAELVYADGVVSVGEAALAGGLGDPTGEVAGPFDCGTDRIATGMRVHAGDIVDAVAARCEPVSILE